MLTRLKTRLYLWIPMMDFGAEQQLSCQLSANHQPLTPFMWSDAGSASTGSRQEVRPETHFQTWSISAAANLQNIAAVKVISAPTENGKKVLTMAEYIEREALMVALCKEIVGDGDYYNGKDDMQDQIRDMVSRFLAADVAPVRHGMWIDLGDNYWERGRTSTRYKCSECGRRAGQKQAKLYHYCPNCGAKMDLEG